EDVEPLGPLLLDDHRVDLAFAEGTDDLLRLFEAVVELLDLPEEVLLRIVAVPHRFQRTQRVGRRSSPARPRSRLERSPMILRPGCGCRRTSVGMARIWSERASCGS